VKFRRTRYGYVVRIDTGEEIIATLRSYRPDLAVSSDFIVGFPGESDKDFAATLALIEEIGFVQAYSFKYSARPGTPAAALPKQIPEDVKDARLAELQALLTRQMRAFNAACIGRTMDVLLTAPGRHAGQLTGRTPYLQAVHTIADSSRIGTVVPVTITAAGPNSLQAETAGADAA